VVVEVEPLMQPSDTNTKVGGKPIAAATAVVDADATGRWGEEDGTPSGTLEEHYQMELPQPFSSCSTCRCG
jgi:hypothetical protein